MQRGVHVKPIVPRRAPPGDTALRLAKQVLLTLAITVLQGRLNHPQGKIIVDFVRPVLISHQQDKTIASGVQRGSTTQAAAHPAPLVQAVKRVPAARTAPATAILPVVGVGSTGPAQPAIRVRLEGTRVERAQPLPAPTARVASTKDTLDNRAAPPARAGSTVPLDNRLARLAQAGSIPQLDNRLARLAQAESTKIPLDNRAACPARAGSTVLPLDNRLARLAQAGRQALPVPTLRGKLACVRASERAGILVTNHK